MSENATYHATTRGISVSVMPAYLESQSEPDDDYFLWAYTIRIENQSVETVQLLTRHWVITDSVGRAQEVKGPGVVGEQPVLEPGEMFEYTSGAPLPTPSGIMQGSYQMALNTGELFDVKIPAFSLDSPHEDRRVN